MKGHDSIHLKIEYINALESKKNLLNSEKNLVLISKAMQDYSALRKKELKKRITLARKAKELVSLLKKMRNEISEVRAPAIGKKHAHPVTFKTRFGIHTFGLKFPIDVLILNSKNRVVVLKKEMKPNRMFVWPLKYETVVELPGGEIERRKINTGNHIVLK